jgi:hypothetical protein
VAKLERTKANCALPCNFTTRFLGHIPSHWLEKCVSDSRKFEMVLCCFLFGNGMI